MSVYLVSAFLAETLFLVKTPPKAPRFGLGPSQLPRRATASLVSQTGLNGSHAGADSIKPICGTRGAAGKKLDFASIGCPKRFFAAAARPLRPKISEMRSARFDRIPALYGLGKL